MSQPRAFDTNVLIYHWNTQRGKARTEPTEADAREWATELIDLHGTNKICTPVRIEFLCNTTGGENLAAIRAYLERFANVDERKVSRDDWDRAEQSAPSRRSDHKGKRHLGDCLIAAIYARKNLDVITSDADMSNRVRKP